jgi:type II secretory pathway component GspD/PulD (secretin)
LYDFITQIADMLKITPIMIDPDVKGTAHIYSSAPMSAQDVFPIFMAVLKSNNAALVKSKLGNFYKIVPISQGLKEGLEIVQEFPTPVIAPQKLEGTGAGNTGGGQIKPPATPPAAGQTPVTTPVEPSGRLTQTASPASPAGEAPRLATHIVRVEFVPIQSLIEPIKLFMTDGGVIMPYERQNMLIITDYSDSLQKILEVIHVLDNNFLDVDLIDLVEIKNNNAADVLEDLKKIFGSGKDGATGIYLTSLDRMNAIMVMAKIVRINQRLKVPVRLMAS